MGKIYLEGADNTRDLGGLKTTEGAVIKDKQLIRSNRLSRITQKDKILLDKGRRVSRLPYSFTENSGFKNTNGSRTRARSGSGGSCL